MCARELMRTQTHALHWSDSIEGELGLQALIGKCNAGDRHCGSACSLQPALIGGTNISDTSFSWFHFFHPILRHAAAFNPCTDELSRALRHWAVGKHRLAHCEWGTLLNVKKISYNACVIVMCALRVSCVYTHVCIQVRMRACVHP